MMQTGIKLVLFWHSSYCGVLKIAQNTQKNSHLGRKIILKTAQNVIKLQFFAIFCKARRTPKRKAVGSTPAGNTR